MLQTVLFVGPGGIVCVVLVEMRELLCSACCEELATAAAAAMYGVREQDWIPVMSTTER